MNLNFISQMLSADGGLSSMRSVMLIVCGVVLAKNIAFNVMALIGGGTPVGFDNTDVAMLLAVITGKVGQTITEKKDGK